MNHQDCHKDMLGFFMRGPKSQGYVWAPAVIDIVFNIYGLIMTGS